MEKNQDKPNGYYLYQDDLLSGYEGIVVAMLEITMKDLTVPDSEIEVSPYDNRKVKDQKNKKEFYKRSAYCFVMSEWFDDLCFLLGISSHPIRQYTIERYNESKKK